MTVPAVPVPWSLKKRRRVRGDYLHFTLTNLVEGMERVIVDRGLRYCDVCVIRLTTLSASEIVQRRLEGGARKRTNHSLGYIPQRD
jgi:hypothetical protein